MPIGDRWGAETSPSGTDQIYATVAEQTAPGIVDVVNSIRVAGESFIDALARARAQVALSDAQSDLLSLNIDRARQGLPPISPQQYITGTPTNQSISANTVLLAVLGLGALILATR
mgnify:CR=1 FL=1